MSSGGEFRRVTSFQGGSSCLHGDKVIPDAGSFKFEEVLQIQSSPEVGKNTSSILSQFIRMFVSTKGKSARFQGRSSGEGFGHLSPI